MCISMLCDKCSDGEKCSHTLNFFANISENRVPVTGSIMTLTKRFTNDPFLAIVRWLLITVWPNLELVHKSFCAKYSLAEAPKQKVKHLTIVSNFSSRELKTITVSIRDGVTATLSTIY